LPSAVPLNQRTLAHHARRVSIPRYDRSALTRGVVHISVGSFHRAHQGVYFDDLAQCGLGDGWALTGVGLHRRKMREALGPQDGLYTVLTRDSGHADARVVGVMTRYLLAADETAKVLAALTDTDTRIVTLTITANGYEAPRRPQRATAPGAATEPHALELVVEALDRRWRLGRPPFTVLSCDNLAENGAIARAATLAVAASRGEKLAAWIEANAAFPNSMVDRITPGTTDADRVFLEREFGVRDRWPVVTERFSQWVIEDTFCHGRPALDEVGAQFVSDVSPYTTIKTRLLNGVHCALGYLGSLAGHERVSDAMAHPVIATYVKRLMEEEIAPLLGGAPVDPIAYAASVRSRLENTAITDPLSRLCRNGSTKMPAHVLSTICDARKAGRPHGLMTLAVAAWCRHLRDGYPGAPDALDDPNGQRLRALARSRGGDPRRLLADERTFGELARCSDFAQAVAREMHALDSEGIQAVIAARTRDDALTSAQAA
jgi:fructuronate reductase/mannitol 2-dehydrogenase